MTVINGKKYSTSNITLYLSLKSAYNTQEYFSNMVSTVPVFGKTSSLMDTLTFTVFASVNSGIILTNQDTSDELHGFVELMGQCNSQVRCLLFYDLRVNFSHIRKISNFLKHVSF